MPERLQTETKNYIFIDALNGIDTCNIKYNSIIKGDAKCYSISAASILAKVWGDSKMRSQNDEEGVSAVYGLQKSADVGQKDI